MKKIILYLIMIIVLCSFASAITYFGKNLTVDNGNLTWYFRMNETSGDLNNSALSTTPHYGMGVSGTPTYNQPAIVNWSTDSIEFDGSTDFFFNDSEVMNNTFNTAFTEGFTIGASFNPDRASGTANEVVVGWYKAGVAQSGFNIQMKDSGKGFLCGNLGRGEFVEAPLDADTDYTVVCSYNTTDVTMWLKNGSDEIVTRIGSDSMTYLAVDVRSLTIGFDGAGENQYFDGNIGEVWLLNQSMTNDAVNETMQHGIGGVLPPPPEPGVPSTPVIQPPSPEDNSHNNTNVMLNVSHSTTQNDVRYWLYFGTSLTLNEGDLIFKNVTRNGSEYSAWFTNVTAEGTYYWKFQVQNITDGNFSLNTTQRTWVYDITIPTITRLTNNNWKIDNTTILSPFIHNLTINISFADDLDLYQSLINFTFDENGTSYFSLHNLSISGTTHNFSTTIDLGSAPLGNYTLILADTDSHTLTAINNYDVKEGLFNDYVEYKTTEGITIRIESLETILLDIRSFSTTKLIDRYTFKWRFWNDKTTTTFRITSSHQLRYVESEYNAHLVTLNGIRGNWIDFNSSGLSKSNYGIKKINDYVYEVTIKNVNQKEFEFNSIGGLNIREEHYKIRLGAVIDIWASDDETNQGLNITAIVGVQFAHGVMNTSPATLVNLTKEITSVVLNASGFGSETKPLNLNSSYHNLSFNMSAVSAIRISFFDEISEELITGETFSVFLETPGFSNTFAGITDNPHTIRDLGTGLYELKASSSNYAEREYRDININNISTTFLNVYLINGTLGQQVTFIVQGSGGEKLDNANMDFLRVISGVNTIIAQEETDFAGQAKLFLEPNYEYGINLVRSNYISRNITLEPSDTEYTIILLRGVTPYESVYQGVRFRFYHNGRMSVSPPDILNLTNTTQNITFEVEGSDLIEIGINFTNHNYACTPASCSVTLAGPGQVKLGILLNESGTFNTAYYFQKTGKKKIYVNDGLIKVIPFIFASLDSLPDWIIEMKEELSPNLRTLLVAMINVIAVGVGSSLGLAGAFLIIPVLGVTIIASLPEIGLIHPFIGMIIAIFGVAMFIYAQTR